MPAWLVPAVISGAGALLGSRSADRASDAQQASSREAIAFQRESRDLVRADTAHLSESSEIVTDALLSMVGLPSVASYGYQGNTRPSGPAADAARDRADTTGLRSTRRGGADPRGGFGPGARDAIHRYGWQSGGGQGRDVSDFRWMGPPPTRGMRRGGYLPEGERAWVGEDGPEIGVPQGGSYGGQIVGWGGPQVIEGGPGGTQVIPNPATPVAGSAPENPGGQPGRYNFMTDPGYGFRFDEGLRGLNTAMAARGRSVGTAMDRSTLRYAQGLASSEYANVFNRLNAIRTGAQTGINTAANATTQAGYGMGQSAQAGGDARASGYLGQYAAWANAGNEFARMGGEYGWF